MEKGAASLDTRAIMQIIPHRYPMLLVDRVIEVEPGQRAVGLKNVTINEPFFQGHYPGRPIMPGVFILEALAQVAGVAVMSVPGNENVLPLFAGIDGARFRRQVVPGDQLQLEAEVTRMRGRMVKVRVKATVEGETAAEAELMFALGTSEDR